MKINGGLCVARIGSLKTPALPAGLWGCRGGKRSATMEVNIKSRRLLNTKFGSPKFGAKEMSHGSVPALTSLGVSMSALMTRMLASAAKKRGLNP